MANLLEISGEAFDRIKAAITSNVNAKSGAIQADLIESFSYNQICFVLASDQRACYVNVEKRGRGGGGEGRVGHSNLCLFFYWPGKYSTLVQRAQHFLFMKV